MLLVRFCLRRKLDQGFVSKVYLANLVAWWCDLLVLTAVQRRVRGCGIKQKDMGNQEQFQDWNVYDSEK